MRFLTEDHARRDVSAAQGADLPDIRDVHSGGIAVHGRHLLRKSSVIDSDTKYQAADDDDDLIAVSFHHL
jgi:hypothetical protein